MGSNDENPAARATSKSNADRTASLLNLLKFSGPGLNQAAPVATPQTTSTSTEGRSSFGPATPRQSVDGRNTPGTDLIAALMSNTIAKPGMASQSQSSSRVPSSSFRPQPSAPPQDTQNYLLALLNRPKPAQYATSPSQAQATPGDTAQSKGVLASDVANLSKALELSSLENASGDAGKQAAPVVFGGGSKPSEAPAKSLFTYRDPFEELSRSSAQNRSSKEASTVEASDSAPLMQILKHPRNSAGSEAGGYNRGPDERGQEESPAYSKRKLDNSDQSSPILILPDGRTELEALIGIGAPNKGKETVSEALSDVGEKVNKQVEAALVQAEKDEAQAEIERDLSEMLNAKTNEEFERTAQVAAQAIKKELDKDGNEHVLEALLSPTTAGAVKEIVEETAQGYVVDSWESAGIEEGSTKSGGGYIVKVFNFPMKPFTSLTINIPLDERTHIRTESANLIARMKKEFDQLDRTLVTATDTFIIYCMPKNGGIRIVHQGTGNHSKLFSMYDDRVFNIAATISGDTEAILGTGVSNTVYWAIISHGEYDEDFHPETKSFALPPSQAHDGDSPGVLKTRARKSGSHTEFFAVGRGKSIYIIEPGTILKDKKYFSSLENRTVDTEKYLNDHAKVINTGKAGKDFTFSPDDSVMVSLDKAGKVRIWDIRPFTGKWLSSKTHVETLESGEIKEPLMTFTTTISSEKSWATSVMFVEKAKPYSKGGALRYLIIGMKQNHTLQLWDIALGKAVQEINLPHEKESDAVCSVLYHPPTSIIVVGHPTRNSIYFIHLSAPKYALTRNQNQAEYIEHLISRDPSSFRPDSTAVMSGIREFSFSTPDREIGALRSLEILQQPTSCNANDGEPVLFELYAMHSKGIACVPIKQEDLGWSPDHKVLNPVNAETAGVITTENIKVVHSIAPASNLGGTYESIGGSPAASVRNSSHHQPAKEAVGRDSGKKVSNSRERFDRQQSSETVTAARPALSVTKAAEKPALRADGSVPELSGSAEKPPRPRRKQRNPTSIGSPSKNEISVPTLLTRNGSPSKSQNLTVPDSVLPAVAPEAVKPPIPQTSAGLDQQAIHSVIKSYEDSITPEISRLVNGSLQNLYKRIDEDNRVHAAAGDAKQEALLRLVSSSLDENVQKTLERAVSRTVETQILPAVIKAATTTLSEQLGGKLAAQLNKALPKEIHASLPDALHNSLPKIIPDAVSDALQKPALQQSLGNSVAEALSGRVEDVVAGAILGRIEGQLNATMEHSIMPLMADLISRTSRTIMEEAMDKAQRRVDSQMQAYAHQHNKDSAQIAQLTQAVTELSNTVSTMADVQTKFQEEMLRHFQSNSRRPTPSVLSAPSVGRSGRAAIKSPLEDDPLADEQFERSVRLVRQRLQNSDVEAAAVAWLQSEREEKIFRDVFSRITNLDFINQLSPLVLLSVGAVVTQDLTGVEALKKLDWLEKILQCFPVQPGYLIPLEDRIRDVLPSTIATIEKRLEAYYNRANAETRGQNPLLNRLVALLKYAQLVRINYGFPGRN